MADAPKQSENMLQLLKDIKDQQSVMNGKMDEMLETLEEDTGVDVPPELQLAA